MSDLSKALGAATSGMQAQSSRLRVVSENLANVDTPGYRRKLMSFEQVEAGMRARPGDANGAVQAGPVRLDRSDLPEIYDPAHPMANEQGYYDGSNVNLMIEIADAREAQRSYEANLKMFEQTRKMSSKLMDLLRK